MNTKLIIGGGVIIGGLILYFKPFPFQKKMYIKKFGKSQNYEVLINSVVDKFTTNELNDFFTFLYKYQKNSVKAPTDLLERVKLIATKYNIPGS